MAWFTRSSRLTIKALALTFVLAVSVSAQTPAKLGSSSISSRIPKQWEFNPKNLSFQGNGPRRLQAGATRGGSCVNSDRPLLALVPASGVGTTISEYPTVFWYQPKTSASSAEFVLFDANQQEIYSARYSLPKLSEDTPSAYGIMSLTLPALANFLPLKIDQEYQWQLSLVCDPIDRSADLVVGGLIKRVESQPNLELRLRQANAQERLDEYIKGRFWYDTVDTLAELRRTSPQDANLASAWEKLLESVNLPTNSVEPWFPVPATITTSKQ
ncbi:MAG: DUF928 domain-containing protein [Symploca sp. SIO3C6]|nr:DUF928 domain-containing protein [Symploca sp. SIO3C6]